MVQCSDHWYCSVLVLRLSLALLGSSVLMVGLTRAKSTDTQGHVVPRIQRQTLNISGICFTPLSHIQGKKGVKALDMCH